MQVICYNLGQMQAAFLRMWPVWEDDIIDLRDSYFSKAEKVERLLGIFEEYPHDIVARIDKAYLDEALNYHFLITKEYDDLRDELFSIIVGWW